MKCGFVQYLSRGEKSDWYLIDWYKDPNNRFDRSVSTIKIPSSQTFRFEGFRTSIVDFLIGHQLKTFESESDHLYIKVGKEMETDIPKVLIETSSKVAAGAVHAVSEIFEAVSATKDAIEIGSDYAKKGMNKAAKQGEVGPGGPNAAYAWLDRQMNKRILVDLQAHAPGGDSSWKVFDKSITFAALASFINTY